MSGDTSPGWHRDPAEPETQRYWDGEQWLGERLPVGVTPPDGPLLTGSAPATPTLPAPVPTPVQATAPPTAQQTWPGHGPAPRHATTPAAAPPTWPGPPGGPPPPAGGPPWTMPVPGPHPPYGTPPRPATTPSGQLLAPLGDRLLARLVDLVVLLGLNVVVNGWFFWQYLREVWPAATAAAATGSFVTQVSERAENLQLAMGLISVALWLAYEVPDTASSGQTLGKRLLGIRVVPLDKRPLGFFRSLRRWSIPGVSMLFPILGVPLLLLDSLWCTWDKPYKQCLHDRSARTAVVRAEPARRTP